MTSKPGVTAELLAEFLGTFVLILFGAGVVAMVVLFPTKNPGEIIHGGFTNITLGWGLGVTMGIYIAGKISGAHLNPAVTLALAVFRKFPWSKVVPYSIAQTAGAFAAAALGIIRRPSAKSTRSWNGLRACLPLFPLSRGCRRPDFSINLSVPVCSCS